jgi:hypothetical protein
VAIGRSIQFGYTKSCGCLKSHTPTWSSWYAMTTRCRSKNGYRDRGIKVCDRWLKYENFLADMGQRPNGTTLDRIDVDGNYEPGNCRWATAREQRNNRRDTKLYTYAGKTMCLADWVREITGNNDRDAHKYAFTLRRKLEDGRTG